MILTDDGAETILNYTAKAEVGGKLASVGSRLVEGVAKKTADDFFGKFSALVAGEAGAEEPAAAVETPAEAPSAAMSVEVGGYSPWVWGVGILLVLGILWSVLVN